MKAEGGDSARTELELDQLLRQSDAQLVLLGHQRRMHEARLKRSRELEHTLERVYAEAQRMRADDKRLLGEAVKEEEVQQGRGDCIRSAKQLIMQSTALHAHTNAQ